MSQYALLDASGYVFNLIDADAEFAESLPGYVASPEIETDPALAALAQVIDVTDTSVGVGWSIADGAWVPPAAPEDAP